MQQLGYCCDGSRLGVTGMSRICDAKNPVVLRVVMDVMLFFYLDFTQEGRIEKERVGQGLETHCLGEIELGKSVTCTTPFDATGILSSPIRHPPVTIQQDASRASPPALADGGAAHVQGDSSPRRSAARFILR